MGGRIVVVEDSAAIRGLVLDILRAHGYAAVGFETAEAALKHLAATTPRALIVDHHLPEMAGAELVRLVRSSAVASLRATPVLGISGRPGTERTLVAAGVTAFISKPFSARNLVSALTEILSPDAPSPSSR